MFKICDQMTALNLLIFAVTTELYLLCSFEEHKLKNQPTLNLTLLGHNIFKICLLNLYDYADFYPNFAKRAGFWVLTIFCFYFIQHNNFSTFKPGRFQADSKEMCNSRNLNFSFLFVISLVFPFCYPFFIWLLHEMHFAYVGNWVFNVT